MQFIQQQRGQQKAEKVSGAKEKTAGGQLRDWV